VSIELEYNLLRLRATGQVENKYYCEINIFVTGVGKTKQVRHALDME
jgi:hypothetical protein